MGQKFNWGRALGAGLSSLGQSMYESEQEKRRRQEQLDDEARRNAEYDRRAAASLAAQRAEYDRRRGLDLADAEAKFLRDNPYQVAVPNLSAAPVSGGMAGMVPQMDVGRVGLRDYLAYGKYLNPEPDVPDRMTTLLIPDEWRDRMGGQGSITVPEVQAPQYYRMFYPNAGTGGMTPAQDRQNASGLNSEMRTAIGNPGSNLAGSIYDARLDAMAEPLWQDLAAAGADSIAHGTLDWRPGMGLPQAIADDVAAARGITLDQAMNSDALYGELDRSFRGAVNAELGDQGKYEYIPSSGSREARLKVKDTHGLFGRRDDNYKGQEADLKRDEIRRSVVMQKIVEELSNGADSVEVQVLAALAQDNGLSLVDVLGEIDHMQNTGEYQNLLGIIRRGATSGGNSQQAIAGGIGGSVADDLGF